MVCIVLSLGKVGVGNQKPMETTHRSCNSLALSTNITSLKDPKNSKNNFFHFPKECVGPQAF